MFSDNLLCCITTEIAVKRQNNNHAKNFTLIKYTSQNMKFPRACLIKHYAMTT
jgi:hypothetical protein